MLENNKSWVRQSDVTDEGIDSELLQLGLNGLLTLLWSVICHKQHAEQLHKCPTLCIKDLTRWQIATAWGAFNPLIVFQSRCQVIYSCSLAAASAFGFLMPYSQSQSRSVMRTWLPPSVCARALYVSEGESEWETGRTGRGKGREIDR